MIKFEESEIEFEARRSRFKPSYKESVGLVKLSLLVLFIFVGVLATRSSHATTIHCPTCYECIDIQATKAIFGDTWICSDSNCGYENYVGINNCGVCGKSR